MNTTTNSNQCKSCLRAKNPCSGCSTLPKSSASKWVCVCGALLPEGQKFCGNCGAQARKHILAVN